MPHTTFSISEVADYLHIPEADIRALVREKAIPFELKGDRPIFLRAEIDSWAMKRIMELPKEALDDYHKTTSAKAHDLSQKHPIIPELMREEYIRPELTSKTVASIIRDMIDVSVQTGMVVYPQDLLRSIERREALCSTALPGGFALLHPQYHEPYMFDDSFITLGRTIQAVPFGSPDGLTTDLFFMICCQDDRIHLHVLARLCMMCQRTSLILELREAEDDAAMFSILINSEEEVIRKL